VGTWPKKKKDWATNENTSKRENLSSHPMTLFYSQNFNLSLNKNFETHFQKKKKLNLENIF
jgi:hypothetical protein